MYGQIEQIFNTVGYSSQKRYQKINQLQCTIFQIEENTGINIKVLSVNIRILLDDSAHL